MTPKQALVLAALDDITIPSGQLCVSFAPLAARTSMTDKADLRRVVRLLARRGWAEYWRGLVDDSGEFAGAGYCITPAGQAALEDYRAAQHRKRQRKAVAA